MNIGETVTLTVRNPLWGNRSAYACPMAEVQTYTGTILPSPSWVGADQLCLSTGTVEFPFRVLDRDRIIGLSQAREKPESKVFTIEGSKGKTYIVTLERGLWGCNCIGFGFRRSCTHVIQAKAQLEGITVEPTVAKKDSATVNSCCFNSRNSVQSKSKVKRSDRRSNLTMEKVNMAKVTKTSVVIGIMTKHADRPMDEVCRIIETQLPCKEGYGRTWYRWAVKEGVAPGTVEATTRTRVVKTKKVSAEKLLNDLNIKKGKYTGKVKAEVTKSADEIAKIKQANLDRMKQVSAKLSKVRGYLPGQVAREQDPTPADFDPQLAREEVAAMIAEIDRERSAMVAPKAAHE